MTLDRYGRLIVNGKPFLPIGLSTAFQPHDDAWYKRISDGGFNLVSSFGMLRSTHRDPACYFDTIKAGLDLTRNTKLVFLWKNDNSNGTQPGAILYNVSVADLTTPCEVPTGLHQELTSFGEPTSTVVWDDDENVSQWNVQYKMENTDWVVETVTTNSFDIVNIVYNTNYF